MKKRAGCFTLFVFLVSCASVALPHGALGCQLGLQCVIVVFSDHTGTHLLFLGV